MPGSNGTLDVIDASYRLGLRDSEWLRGIAAAAQMAHARGTGTAAFLFDVSVPSQGVRARDFVLIDAPEAALEAIGSFHSSLSPDDVEALFVQPPLCATLSQMGVALDDRSRQLGVGDVLAVQATDASGVGCCLLFVAPAERRRLSPSLRRCWVGVAHHIQAALRLRLRLAHTDLWDRVEAVIDPGGRVDARGPAAAPEARATLQRQCRCIDRARLRRRTAGAGDGGAAAQAWPLLVAGRWSLIEHVDSGGHRYFLAVCNPPEAAAVVKLTCREHQVVSGFVAGRPARDVAMELGLGEATAKAYLRRAMAKLRVHSRAELVELDRTMWVSRVAMGDDELLVMRAQGDVQAVLDALELTSAEREVALGILGGKSNADIARGRGTRARTVANQVQSLFRKLGVSSRAELVAAVAHRSQ